MEVEDDEVVADVEAGEEGDMSSLNINPFM